MLTYLTSNLKSNYYWKMRLFLGIITKMEELISNVLEYASVDRVAEEFAPVDTKELLQEIEDLIFVPEHIELQVADDLPVVSGNRVMLQQLFQNLIVNAIKYRQQGVTPWIHIRCQQSEGGMGERL